MHPDGHRPEQQGSELTASYVEAHLSDDRFTICQAGTIGVTNALDTFFDCAEVMQVEKGIRFMIVGSGDLLNHYKRRAARLPNVHFAPAVAKEQVAAVLRRCDALYFAAHPSAVWRFGLSLNKLTDYMLAGKPVIGSYSGYPTVTEEAGGGTVVPAADVEALRKEILRYRDMSSTEREVIGERGRRWVLAHRTYATLAARYIDVIRSILP